MRVAAVALAAAALAVPLAAAKADRAQLRFRPIASGLRGAWFIDATRSEPSRLYVVQKGGRVRVLVDGRVRSRPFLDIGGLVESAGPEQGLFSLAFHPRYGRNHRFYVAYTDNRGDLRVVEYRSNGVRAVRRLRQLLFVDEPYTRNAGGQLQFGPDGLLYAALGDGGWGGNPGRRSQDLSSKLGKLLRIDVDRRGARWQTVGYGLRYPWRFSFDRKTGDLYLADRGPNGVDNWEEVDVRPRARLGALANYGWSRYQGRVQYRPTPLNPKGELVFPVAVHSHQPKSGHEACLVTGGYVYGDAYTSEIWSLRMVDGKATDIRREPMKIGSVSTFGEDARGELYAAAPRRGVIYKLTSAT